MLTDHSGASTPQSPQYTSAKSASIEAAPLEPAVPLVSKKAVITLDPEEKESLRRLASRLGADPGKEAELYCRQAARLAKQLPDSLWDLLRSFSRSSNKFGFLVINGLP